MTAARPLRGVRRFLCPLEQAFHADGPVSLYPGWRAGPYRRTRSHPVILTPVQEHALAERLITYDTSNLEGIQSAAGFIKGWLESRDVDVTVGSHNGRPVIAATVGAAAGAGPR